MNAPKECGWWVAFFNTIHPGGFSEDIKRVIDVCKATDARWVALRMGQGKAGIPKGKKGALPGEDTGITKEAIQAFKTEGIDPYLWVFNYRGYTPQELKLYEKGFGWGAVGAITNAEFPFNGASPAEARALIEGIRAVAPPGAFVGHAPPDYLGSRGGDPIGVYDAWEEFDAICDGIMPQVYAPEHNDMGHVYHLNRVFAGYEKRGLKKDKVWPILGSYRPYFRGTDAENRPIPVPYKKDEPQWMAADVVAGLDWVKEQNFPAWSFYSLEALFNAQAQRPDTGKAVLEAITEWTMRNRITTPERVPYTPEGPANPLGRADRAEQEAEDKDGSGNV